MKNFFFQQDLHFTLRGDGLHQYHFANDLTWSGGPGYYFVRNPKMIAVLQMVISGEYKDVDRFRGQVAEDTAITSVFAGPSPFFVRKGKRGSGGGISAHDRQQRAPGRAGLSANRSDRLTVLSREIDERRKA
jgi:hypothetical protein